MMIRILWNAFLLAVIALVAAWLSNNAGTSGTASKPPSVC